MIIHIEKRKELTEYFDKYAKGGYYIRSSEGGQNVHIKFMNKRDVELIVPLIDIVFYAGFSSRAFWQTIDEKRET